jgi:hypothetical protein
MKRKFQFTVGNMLWATAWLATSFAAWSWLLVSDNQLDDLKFPYFIAWVFFSSMAPYLAIDCFAPSDMLGTLKSRIGFRVLTAVVAGTIWYGMLHWLL